MAHFARIDENSFVDLVTPVIDEFCNGGNDDESGNAFLNEIGLSGVWIRCSYNTYGGQHSLGGTPLRKNYPAVGFYYDQERDAFIPPKPFNSWILNEDSCLWEAPVPKPIDGPYCYWDEENGEWVVEFNEPV